MYVKLHLIGSVALINGLDGEVERISAVVPMAGDVDYPNKREMNYILHKVGVERPINGSDAELERICGVLP